MFFILLFFLPSCQTKSCWECESNPGCPSSHHYRYHPNSFASCLNVDIIELDCETVQVSLFIPGRKLPTGPLEVWVDGTCYPCDGHIQQGEETLVLPPELSLFIYQTLKSCGCVTFVIGNQTLCVDTSP